MTQHSRSPPSGLASRLQKPLTALFLQLGISGVAYLGAEQTQAVVTSDPHQT